MGYLESLESHNKVYGNSMVRSGKVKIAADLNTMRYVAVAISGNDKRSDQVEQSGTTAE